MFAFLTATFYLWVGRSDTPGNEPNVAGLMFMWCASLPPAHRCSHRLGITRLCMERMASRGVVSPIPLLAAQLCV